MALLYSDSNLINNVQHFFSSAENFTIFAPYIRKEVLALLLDGAVEGKKNTIVTSWKPQDVALGISDIDVYPFCAQNGITLLVNNRIHLKFFVKDDFQACIISSFNISSKGLALAPNFNYELGVLINDLDIDAKIYFDVIIEESDAVTQSYYNQAKEQAEALVLEKQMPEAFRIERDPSDAAFLLTALPMSDDVETLFEIYHGNTHYEHETLRSAVHDLRLYKIPESCSEDEFIEVFGRNFFDHPFIVAFLKYNGAGRYFGDLTSWLHDNCTTVPTPRRFEIKSALRRIFRFVEALSSGKYVVEVPERHSDFLKRVRE